MILLSGVKILEKLNVILRADVYCEQPYLHHQGVIQ